MMGRFFFIIIFSLGFSTLVQSQINQYNFLHRDISNGLSHNQVNTIHRDKKGFVWVGTMSGLNRYDGYEFKVFRNSVKDSTSLIDNYVNDIFEDDHGRIWVSTFYGICIYDPQTQKFDRDANAVLEEYNIPSGMILNIVVDSENNLWFIHQTQGLFKYDIQKATTVKVEIGQALGITSFIENRQGDFWIFYSNGIFKKLNGKNLTVDYVNTDLEKHFSGETLVYKSRLHTNDDLWIYFEKSNRGLYYFDVKKHVLKHIHKQSGDIKLNNDIVRDIEVADNGLVWVATDHGGLNIIDLEHSAVTYLLHDPQDGNSIAHNTLNTIYKDSQGIMWLGTQKGGLNYYHEDINKFPLFRHQIAEPNSLPYDDINQIVEDKMGNLWLGTNGGGLIYFNRQLNTFKRFVNNPRDANSLTNNIIVSLCLDHEGYLWIGTYYGGLDKYDGNQFTHYRHDSDNVKSISDDNIWNIYEDVDYNLWIGTLTGGLNKLGSDRKNFKRFTEESEGIFTGYVTATIEDRHKNIWVGTGFGLTIYNKKDNSFKHLLGSSVPGSLSNNSVLDLLLDSRGYIWVGTQDGLNIYDEETGTFKNLRIEDGLLDNGILSILEDASGNIWVSTPIGISSILINEDPLSDNFKPEIKNYDESDGLQGKQFNFNSALQTSLGELAFGGVNGFNIFDPKKIAINHNKPTVVLVDFQIHNNSVRIGEEVSGHVILTKSITETSEVELSYTDNVISIEFAALSFFHPERNLYRYKLEGFDNDWVETDGLSRKVTYTNLDPGNYIFKVIAANSDGVWNETGVSLSMRVSPPFWKTPLAMVIYVFLIIGALLMTRRLILNRERMKFKLDQERSEAVRIHELDLLKIRFFTNVSHEFRTPLTLILAPIERLLKKSNDQGEKTQYLLIQRNAKRLLNLVNQLLDFRRMEVEEVKLNPSEGDIVKFIKDVVHSFSDLSEKNNVRFQFITQEDSIETLFDQNKLERILFNLISNAFKFTPEGGEIQVELFKKTINNSPWLEIKVEDTGIGIPRENHEKIFERFFQNNIPSSMVNQGSGIGLSITKEFVNIHGGSITVESEPDKGSCFTVLLPIKEIALSRKEIEDVDEEELNVAEETTVQKSGKRKPILLLVEDNEDFRFYLKDNLKLKYQIIEAMNGRDGWKQALHTIPDLIVSDIMMPEIDGIELCRKIKTDQRTSHIPVILLTARSAEEQKMEGFEVGADDYVTKPFSFEILQSRIKNLIASRAAFQKTFQKTIEVKASKIKVSSLDEQLIEKAIKLVEEKISDSEFSVEDLSHELGMSRVHLYKKLLSLTGKSPLEFIRTLRLQRAAQLLEQSQLTVAEVAYKVGFNNPKYFARYFKEQFKKLPSAYAASKKNDEKSS